MEQQTQAQLEKKQRVIESYGHPVTKVDGQDGKYNIVDRFGKVISEVSERYTLVQNADVINPLVKHFGLENLKQMFSYAGGRNLFMSFESGKEIDLGNGDIIRERFIAVNSYDKTRSFQFMLGAFRLVCTNGLFAQFSGVSYKKIHVGEIPLNEIINNSIQALGKNNYENWRKLKSVSLTGDQQIDLINGFDAIDVKDPSDRWASGNVTNAAIKRIASLYVNKPESVDNQRNAWGLYNQINRAIHSEFYSAAKTSQKISVNLKAENYLLEKLSLN